MENPSQTTDAARPPATLWALYWGFLSIGARSFGGVLPWAHRVLVEERRWVAPGDFAEVLALCQFLPGPNVGNVSVVLGRRWFGLRGAVVAFLGLMALPLVWVFGLALLYADFSSNPEVRAVITGVGVAGRGAFREARRQGPQGRPRTSPGAWRSPRPASARLRSAACRCSRSSRPRR